MKILFFALALTLVGTFAFAASGYKPIPPEETSELVINQNQENFHKEECELSATGTVDSAQFGELEVTVTVKGPCDSRLAYKLINEIETVRNKLK